MTPETNQQETLYFNGINGDSGEYDLPPMTGPDLFGFIQGESKPENLSELRFRFQQATQRHLGVKEGVDPKKLDEAGWGVIFAHDADPAVKEALGELIELRREQAGEYFKIYEGSAGYRPGEAKKEFLGRHGAGPGPADPEKVPYYLLIVGSPEAIPYRFQSQLDVQYAVGRIHFDTLDEYDAYARSVVAAEKGTVKLPRQAAFFGVANDDDRATIMSADSLVQPIYDGLKAKQTAWEFTAVTRQDATKARLAQLLGGDQTPALLFTASHGMSFPLGSPRQLPHQGALLCQDWPGPEAWHAEIPQSFYFAGDDLRSDANLLGLIAFFFACYSDGTPLEDEFAKQAFRDRSAIAPHAFLAQLPTRMLGHPRGGALAVIGHIERAWGYSFVWPGAGKQTEVFESTLRRLLDGHPVGSAIEYFNERYAELSTVLNDELEEIEFGKTADPYELSGMWTANNDARGYAIIGDPAVRLPVAKADETAQDRPLLVVRSQGSGNNPVTNQVNTQVEAVETSGSGTAAAQNHHITNRPAIPPESSRGSNRIEDEIGPFTPLPQGIPDDYRKKHPELYAAWVKHIETGYHNNAAVFTRILNAFMDSHKSTLIMYWILFSVGIALFVIAAYLAVFRGETVAGLIFGGLSVITFLTYFISRPTQAIEENLEFITWLGIVYNSYWTQLAWSFDEDTSQGVLDKATKDAIRQLNALIDKHAAASRRRPDLKNQAETAET